ncbi:MAG: hypothetical protein ABIJ14_01380 [Nanoarchaeota archaeon]|nr:hypothetical protein [Nanoarchaeota archaeon]
MKKLDSSKILRVENYKGKIPIREIVLREPFMKESNLCEIIDSNNVGMTQGILAIANIVKGEPKKNEPTPIIYFGNESDQLRGLVYQNSETLKFEFYRFPEDFNYIA